MSSKPLTPLRFSPIFKSALWGGSRLGAIFNVADLPDPTGEAWVLSDQGDNSSVVRDGAYAGTTLRELVQTCPERILGRVAPIHGRFPLLLKFLHVRQPLSVQVHPTDAKACESEGPTATGKTEAWYIIEADPTARMYCGLQAGVTADRLRQAINQGNVEPLLYSHYPSSGEAFLVNAGIVHALAGGLLLFEIQQTSDLTYRLHDWGRTDPKTGKARELHVEKGLAVVNFTHGPCRPTLATEEGHGRVRLAPLVECDYFSMGRWDTAQPFRAGEDGDCRILVGVGGNAVIQHEDVNYPIGLGDVWMLPAEVGACEVVPQGTAEILECSIPE